MSRTVGSGTSHSSSGSGSQRFVAGTVLAGRYRIVSRIGRGGMGEVYRADDLKLDQPVALKFLPEELEHDSQRLARLLSEVRLARQVSHPNVCRVYDIEEAEGQHFLSMELVDGEDLGSLLKKVDRLAGDRAIRIARQIGAGLQAAHDEGVLHRDLKPQNVMIDGEGRVRLTDFGLAELAQSVHRAEARAGTPAYMAPEQIEGRPATIRSEVYSLGIVLYELFTGKRPFTEKDRTATPSTPSSLVEAFDPAIERVILSCLETDPELRPPSVANVLAALPGGDPLAAALEAGETPSPAQVAGSGGEGSLRVPVAAALLLFTLTALGLGAYLHGQDSMLARAKPELSPAVLVDRARQALKAAGHDLAAEDSAYSIYAAEEIPGHIAETDSSADRWDRLSKERPHVIAFNYRQATAPLTGGSYGHVTETYPPPINSGMANVTLNGNGQLYGFEVVPPQLDERTDPVEEPDYAPVFAAAGLELADFEAVEPVWRPSVYCDELRAWIGSPPGWMVESIRVEAGSYRGTPNFFQIVGPGMEPWRVPRAWKIPLARRINNVFYAWLDPVLLFGGLLLAARNLRLGRGDRKGAVLVGSVAFISQQVAWFFQAHHNLDLAEIDAILDSTAWALLRHGILTALMYLALEPFIRRRWPGTLVSWSRLVAGRVRDPLVGRHVLYGSAVGGAVLLLYALQYRAPTLFGNPPGIPASIDWDALLGPRWAIGELFLAIRHMIVQPMTALFMIALAALIVRSRWVGMAVVVIVSCIPDPGWLDYPAIQLPFTLFMVGISVLLIVRCGLVGGAALSFVGMELREHPMTLDFSTWYAGSTGIALTVAVCIAIYGFVVSIGGQPILREPD